MAPDDRGSDDVDLEALTDLRTPWCALTVASLGLGEPLAAGITAVDELATATGVDARALHNVLSHLAGRGVFVEVAPGHFEANAAARRLLDPSAFLHLDGIGGRMARAWSTLPIYVRTGEPGYHEVFGVPFWEDLAAHPDVAADFDALIGPAGHGAPDPALGFAGGWASVGTVVDVGGGKGAFVAAVVQAHPHVRATLVDLPGTVARAEGLLDAAGVSDRVTVVGQSFFDPLPAGADLYVLRSILNDWPDEETTAILRRCAEAARPDGRVVVVGGVAAGDAPRRLEIEMVLLGGRTDSEHEFRRRATGAGLAVIAAGPTPAGRFVVECRPV
jgi:hypothetical protein